MFIKSRTRCIRLLDEEEKAGHEGQPIKYASIVHSNYSGGKIDRAERGLAMVLELVTVHTSRTG